MDQKSTSDNEAETEFSALSLNGVEENSLNVDHTNTEEANAFKKKMKEILLAANRHR